MTPRIYAYIAIVVLAGAGLYTIKHLYDQNATLRAETSRLETERDNAVREGERLDNLLAEKIKADANTARELSRLRGSFAQEKQNDPELRDWAGTPLPDGAVRILQNRGGAAPAEPDGAD